MQDFHSGTRRCATCLSWEGERRADPAGDRIQTPRHAIMGYCRSAKSWWNQRPRQAESVCRFWERWSAGDLAGMDEST